MQQDLNINERTDAATSYGDVSLPPSPTHQLLVTYSWEVSPGLPIHRWKLIDAQDVGYGWAVRGTLPDDKDDKIVNVASRRL